MKYLTVYLFLSVFAATLFNANNSYSQSKNEIKYGVIKVKFKKELTKHLDELSKKPLLKSSEGAVLTGIGSIDKLNKQFTVSKMERVFPHAGKFEEKHRKYGLHLWYKVVVDDKTDVDMLSYLKGYKNDGYIEHSEFVYEKKLVDGSSVEPEKLIIKASPNFTSNDPRFSEQWHYLNTGQTGGTIDADIDLDEAWDIQMGSSNVIVAVIDGGIDYTHVDLAANMWVNQAEFSGQPGIDDDGNGYIDDVHGYSFGDVTGNVNPHNHGTHVGGTISAVTNNGIGVAGVAGGAGYGDGVRLMTCATFGSYGTDGFDEAFIYAADNGAVISQNSWGYTGSDYYEQSVLDAIDYFVENAGYDEHGTPFGPMQGGIVIFAAGNSNNNALYYPGCYERVLSVASTNHNDQKSWYSNYASWVDISAPGGETDVENQGVLSTLPGNSYGFYQGTSMACPHVSGVAALAVSQFGQVGFLASQLRDILIASTDPIEDLNPSYQGLLGSGRLNAFNALNMDDDGIPPASIDDLSVDSLGMTTIALKWIATGGSDNSGRASYYDIRYADFQITSANFNSAIKLNNPPRPRSAGESEYLEISNLLPATTYYFAIKASDFFNNESSISNIVNGRTLDPPVVTVNPTYLEASVYSCTDSVTVPLTISNTGIGNLSVEVIKSRNFFEDFENGLDNWNWTGNWGLIANSFKGAFALTESPSGNYGDSWNQYIELKEPLTVSKSDSCRLSYWYSTQMESCCDYLRTRISVNGGSWQQIDSRNGTNQWNNPEFNLSQYVNDGDNINIRFEFTSDGSVTYDGALIDDILITGIGNSSDWINYDAVSTNLSEGSSVSLDIKLKAEGLIAGVYLDSIIVKSNDPVNPIKNIPCTFTVHGIPGISLSDTCLNFGEVFIGGHAIDSVQIFNTGCDTLKITNIASSIADFSIDKTSTFILPGDSGIVYVDFGPNSATDFDEFISFSNNSVDTTIRVTGTGLEPNVIDLRFLL